MVGRVGIEPTTSRLKAECSTSELTPHQVVAKPAASYRIDGK